MHFLRHFSKMKTPKMNENKELSTRFQLLANHAYNGAENRLSSNRVQNSLIAEGQPILPAKRGPNFVQETVQRGSRETHQNDSGSPYTIMQPAPIHSTSDRNGSTATYAKVYSLAQRRNTKLCPEPLLTQSIWFLRRAKKKSGNSMKERNLVKKSRSCVTALLTRESRPCMKIDGRRKH